MRCPVCGFGMADPLNDFMREVMRLKGEIIALCSDPNPTRMAKKGIEAHGKLRKIAEELKQIKLRIDGLSEADRIGFFGLAEADHRLALARRHIHEMTRLLLTDAFGVDPKTATDYIEGKGGTVPPTTRLPVDSISGVSLAATKTFANDEFASVEVRLNNIKVEGIAKRDPADKPNQDIGLTLATGRALRKLGGQIINEANKAVAEADRERRKEQAAKAQARSEQRKAERKVVAERTAVHINEELKVTVHKQDRMIADLVASLEAQSETIAEFQRLEEARKARDYKQRIAKRKANAAAKKAPAKAKAKA